MIRQVHLSADDMFALITKFCDMVRNGSSLEEAVAKVRSLSEDELHAVLAAVAGLTQAILPLVAGLAGDELYRRGLPPVDFQLAGIGR